MLVTDNSAHQVVQLWIFTEEGLVFSFLLVHKVFDVHVKAGWCDAFRTLRGLLTFFEQQGQKGEQWVSEEGILNIRFFKALISINVYIIMYYK